MKGYCDRRGEYMNTYCGILKVISTDWKDHNHWLSSSICFSPPDIITILSYLYLYIYRIETQSLSSFFSTSVTMKTGLWLRMKMYFVTINRYILQFGQIYFWLRSRSKMAMDKVWEDDKVEQLRRYKLKSPPRQV